MAKEKKRKGKNAKIFLSVLAFLLLTILGINLGIMYVDSRPPGYVFRKYPEPAEEQLAERERMKEIAPRQWLPDEEETYEMSASGGHHPGPIPDVWMRDDNWDSKALQMWIEAAERFYDHVIEDSEIEDLGLGGWLR